MTPKKRVKTFALDQIAQLFEQAGIVYRISGKEIDADPDRTGHRSYKINPPKGLYFDAATGKGGTIAALLKRLLKRLGVDTTASAPNLASESFPRPAFGGQQDTGAIALRLWMQSWTCTHADDMPIDWDRGLSTGQKAGVRTKIEHERDAARVYIQSRLGAEHLDHWMRQVRIAKGGVLLAPMLKNGVVVGAQRTFLDQQGHKIERKMLGKHGVMPLPAPVGVAPLDLGIGAYVVVGEGFETTAAAVQAAGVRGIVCHDAGGTRRWADEQARAAKNWTNEQKKKKRAPAAVFLVDRDLSETGQKACAYAVAVLRKAGLRAFFATPPTPEDGGPKGRPKGSDWGDYPRENISTETQRAHLALAVARGDEAMNPYVPDSDSIQSENSMLPWRKPDVPAPVAEAVPVEQAREEQKTALQELVRAYLDWWSKDSNERGPFSPWLFQQTTGIGKTSELLKLSMNPDLRMAGARVCVGVGDHTQALSFEDAGYFHFWGRQPDESRCPAAYCPAYQELQKAQETHHIAQAEYCRTCNHGLAWAIQAARGELNFGSVDEARQAELEDKIADHEATLLSRGLNPEQVEPCPWQSHLRRALAEQFVVLHHDSYSHSLVQAALYVTDEGFATAKSLDVGLEEVAAWAGRVQSSLGIPGLKDQVREGFESTLALFRSLSRSLAKWAGEGKTGAVFVDPDLMAAISDLLDLAKDRAHLPDWERLAFAADGSIKESPLRAAWAIAQSLKYDMGHVDKGRLVVAGVNPIVERLSGGIPVVMMDATPDPVVEDVVRSKGGRIVRAIARQNLRITRYPQRFWGLSALDKKRVGRERVDRELRRYSALRATYPDAAILVHKRAADALGEDSKEWDGYWGRDHRAHNGWTGRDMTVVGGFYPPVEAWRREYEAARLAALTAGCPEEDWSTWADDMPMVTGLWVSEGDHEVQSRMPLPADQKIREWLLRRVTAETVQAIGRARAVNSERQIEVRIFGGLPLFGLGDHGLSVAEYAADPVELGQSRAQVNADRHEAAMLRLDAAAARVVAKGQVISAASLAGEVQATGTDGAFYGHGYSTLSKPVETKTMPFSYDTYQKWLARIREKAPALYAHMATTGRGAAVVRAMRDVLERFGKTVLRVAVEVSDGLLKQGDTVAWDALDEADAKADLPEWQAIGMVLAAALGADGPPEEVPACS